MVTYSSSFARNNASLENPPTPEDFRRLARRHRSHSWVTSPFRPSLINDIRRNSIEDSPSPVRLRITASGYRREMSSPLLSPGPFTYPRTNLTTRLQRCSGGVLKWCFGSLAIILSIAALVVITQQYGASRTQPANKSGAVFHQATVEKLKIEMKPASLPQREDISSSSSSANIRKFRFVPPDNNEHVSLNATSEESATELKRQLNRGTNSEQPQPYAAGSISTTNFQKSIEFETLPKLGNQNQNPETPDQQITKQPLEFAYESNTRRSSAISSVQSVLQTHSHLNPSSFYVEANSPILSFRPVQLSNNAYISATFYNVNDNNKSIEGAFGNLPQRVQSIQMDPMPLGSQNGPKDLFFNSNQHLQQRQFTQQILQYVQEQKSPASKNSLSMLENQAIPQSQQSSHDRNNIQIIVQQNLQHGKPQMHFAEQRTFQEGTNNEHSLVKNLQLKPSLNFVSTRDIQHVPLNHGQQNHNQHYNSTLSQIISGPQFPNEQAIHTKFLQSSADYLSVNVGTVIAPSSLGENIRIETYLPSDVPQLNIVKSAETNESIQFKNEPFKLASSQIDQNASSALASKNLKQTEQNIAGIDVQSDEQVEMLDKIADVKFHPKNLEFLRHRLNFQEMSLTSNQQVNVSHKPNESANLINGEENISNFPLFRITDQETFDEKENFIPNDNEPKSAVSNKESQIVFESVSNEKTRIYDRSITNDLSIGKELPTHYSQIISRDAASEHEENAPIGRPAVLQSTLQSVPFGNTDAYEKKNVYHSSSALDNMQQSSLSSQIGSSFYNDETVSGFNKRETSYELETNQGLPSAPYLNDEQMQLHQSTSLLNQDSVPQVALPATPYPNVQSIQSETQWQKHGQQFQGFHAQLHTHNPLQIGNMFQYDNKDLHYVNSPLNNPPIWSPPGTFPLKQEYNEKIWPQHLTYEQTYAQENRLNEQAYLPSEQFRQAVFSQPQPTNRLMNSDSRHQFPPQQINQLDVPLRPLEFSYQAPAVAFSAYNGQGRADSGKQQLHSFAVPANSFGTIDNHLPSSLNNKEINSLNAAPGLQQLRFVNDFSDNRNEGNVFRLY